MTQHHEPQDAASSAPDVAGPVRSTVRESMVGLDHSSIMGAELVSAIAVWTGIGWLADRWLGTDPWLLIIGALIGNAAGLYLIWLRSGRMEAVERAALAERRRPRIVTSPGAAVVDAVVAGRTGIPTSAHTHDLDPDMAHDRDPDRDARQAADARAPEGRRVEH
jgi:F0F1-type ATP synthase assembly protein I